jgi:hypothetical protein
VCIEEHRDSLLGGETMIFSIDGINIPQGANGRDGIRLQPCSGNWREVLTTK